MTVGVRLARRVYHPRRSKAFGWGPHYRWERCWAQIIGRSSHTWGKLRDRLLARLREDAR